MRAWLPARAAALLLLLLPPPPFLLTSRMPLVVGDIAVVYLCATCVYYFNQTVNEDIFSTQYAVRRIASL